MEIEVTAQNNSLTLTDNPYYFAHYANMARHNAYIVLNEINEKIYNNKVKIPEDGLSECKLVNSFSKKNKKADVA